MQFPTVKLAAVQASSVFLDRERSIDKAARLILEAGRNGANLVGFPESFLPGFPSWVFHANSMRAGGRLFARLYKNAVSLDGDDLVVLQEAARSARIHVCMSATELAGGSLYLTQFWLNPEGELIAKHRKLKPSAGERTVWGEGDGSTLRVLQTPVGRMGGLQCWEHFMPLVVAAMAQQTEQIHVASWPPAAFTDAGLFQPMRACKEAALGVQPINSGDDMSSRELTSRHYALSTQSFVVMATGMMSDEGIEIICAEDESLRPHFKVGGGGARIIGPDGLVLSGILPATEEGIVYATAPLEMLIYGKYVLDIAGHYSVPQVLSLQQNQSPPKSLAL